jgi:hypothetical protein
MATCDKNLERALQAQNNLIINSELILNTWSDAAREAALEARKSHAGSESHQAFYSERTMRKSSPEDNMQVAQMHFAAARAHNEEGNIAGANYHTARANHFQSESNRLAKSVQTTERSQEGRDGGT